MNQWILDELDRFKWPLSYEDSLFLKKRYVLDNTNIRKMSKTEVYNLLWPEEQINEN